MYIEFHIILRAFDLWCENSYWIEILPWCTGNPFGHEVLRQSFTTFIFNILTFTSSILTQKLTNWQTNIPQNMNFDVLCFGTTRSSHHTPKKKGRFTFVDQIMERVKLPRIWSFCSSKCSLSKWVFWGRANVLKLQRGNFISCYGRPHPASTSWSWSSMIISLLILAYSSSGMIIYNQIF